MCLKAKRLKKIKVPLTLYFCSSCKNVQIKEVINQSCCGKNILIFQHKQKLLLSILIHFQKTIKRFDLSTKDIILDIGSNDGSLLKKFKNKGIYNVIGVDPAKKIVQEANKKRLKLFTHFLTKIFQINY